MDKIKDVKVVEWFESLYNNKAIYLWGADGQVITKELTDKLFSIFKSVTYNKQYYDDKLKEGSGKIGSDCSGAFTKITGKNQTARTYYSETINKGMISNIPTDKVCLVWNKNLTHIGLYCGNGYTIEMKSSKYNCVKEKFNPSRWYYYGLPDWIEYTVKPVVQAVLKPQKPVTVHIVKSGDTLSEIAEQYNTTVEKLVKLNGIKNANSLSIGQKIKLK